MTHSELVIGLALLFGGVALGVIVFAFLTGDDVRED
jgi:hypothetical protein